jgi:formylglycine-generating enzyme required for sulfatase activity
MAAELRVLLAASVAGASAIAACMFDLPPPAEELGAKAPPDGTAAQQDAPPVGNDEGGLDAEATRDADSGVGDAGPEPCPEAGLVRVGNGDASFCIDGTEVTNRSFIEFLDSGAWQTITGSLSDCQWNASNAPNIPSADSLPAVNVNWCDAYGYCRWAGKHLCGTPRGEWFAACSHENDGQHTYPYGNTLDPSACNAGDIAPLSPVRSSAKCVGGYGGIFDMVGNAAEWEDACDDAGFGPEYASCNARGGAWDDLPRACSYIAPFPRATRAVDLGFRCCL